MRPSDIEPDKYKGRKPSYDRTTFDVCQGMLKVGVSPTEISDILDISRQCVYRIKDDPEGCLEALRKWGLDKGGDSIVLGGVEDIVLDGRHKRVVIQTDGGPSDYYDFPSGWTTLNDYIESKCKRQWLGPESFHWGNVTKALCRWGDKEGTTKEYDTKKVIYSGVRVLMALVGPTKTRQYMQGLMDDPQFQEKENT